MKSLFILILTIISLINISFLQAGVVGKILGQVVDSENGEALPGVNVFIEGTNLGAATDIEGYYYILNVPPGDYTVKFEYIGYAPYIVKNVKVQINLTSEVSVEMKPEVLETEAVVVVADRPVVVRDISNSQLNIEAEVIETLPVANANEVLTLQAGIENSSTGIVIRGGGSNQTVYMVDGHSYNDERSHNPYGAVSLSSVEEIQVQTGGFNAEYGQARSGIVNFVTKEGNSTRYTGVISLQYSPAAPKHFGPSIYDKYSYFNRPYFDPAVCWVGVDNGTWDEYTKFQYYDFPGWNLLSEELLQDEDPTNDLTPEGLQRLFSWYRRRNGNIKKADYVIDIGVGGPLPFIAKDLGNARFYLSHYRLRDMFVFPLAKDAWDENHTSLKLTTNINPSMKLIVSGLYGEEHSVSSYSWTTTPTGRLLRLQSEVANLPNSAPRGRMVPFMPDYYSPGSIYRNIWGAKFVYTISKNSLLEARLQYKYSKHNVHQTTIRDTSKIYEIVPGYYVDEAPYGYWGYGAGAPGDIHLGGWMNLGRDYSANSTTTFGFDYITQFDLRNEIKSGLEIVYNDYDIQSSTFSPSMSTWSRTQIYRIFPFRFSAYVQDKLEYEGFIANVGVRFDYSNSNTDVYGLAEYDSFYTDAYGEFIENQAPSNDSKANYSLSPRLGISHPITENSKLYFNYGHFRSEPFSTYRFRLQRENNGTVTSIGDPNLGLEKTVAYELGYEQGLLDMFLFKAAGYYKDISEQPGWINYIGTKNVRYAKATNNNYADIRGLELTLSKRRGKWITGFINYTYDVRTSGYFGLLYYFEDLQEQRDYNKLNPTLNRRHPIPFARANINIFTPKEFGPFWETLDLYPLGGWNFNILADWQTGRYETFNPLDKPGIVDDVQWRDWYNVDLRISKNITIEPFEFQVYMDITNVFNFKYMYEAGFADQYDRLDYLYSLHFPWERGHEKGNDRVGDYRKPGVEYVPIKGYTSLDQITNPDERTIYYVSETGSYMNYDFSTGKFYEVSDKRMDQILEDKAYIDMPNITSLTFLNPRTITFGIRISF